VIKKNTKPVGQQVLAQAEIILTDVDQYQRIPRDARIVTNRIEHGLTLANCRRAGRPEG
jgi:hypothetical protein